MIENKVEDNYDYFMSIEKSYGRIEIRKCWSCENIG